MNQSSKLLKYLEGMRIVELLQADERAIFPLFGLSFDLTAETVLAEGTFEYAGFMEDDRYVLCQDTDRTVLVLDTENGRILARRPFPKAEYGDIVPVSDHCFSILHEGQNRLCWIDWEYEGEKGT